jgi:hypothetical protein
MLILQGVKIKKAASNLEAAFFVVSKYLALKLSSSRTGGILTQFF